MILNSFAAYLLIGRAARISPMDEHGATKRAALQNPTWPGEPGRKVEDAKKVGNPFQKADTADGHPAGRHLRHAGWAGSLFRPE